MVVLFVPFEAEVFADEWNQILYLINVFVQIVSVAAQIKYKYNQSAFI